MFSPNPPGFEFDCDDSGVFCTVSRNFIIRDVFEEYYIGKLAKWVAIVHSQWHSDTEADWIQLSNGDQTLKDTNGKLKFIAINLDTDMLVDKYEFDIVTFEIRRA